MLELKWWMDYITTLPLVESSSKHFERHREMAEESQLSQQKQHFVMVHGAGHGAWCWYKLRYHLQNSGHKVSCLDLAGAGIDPSDPNTLFSFHDYNQPLTNFLSSLPPNHKVVLVGHSAGGLSLTAALHEFGDKISLAIFVAATMLPFGFLTEQDKLDGWSLCKSLQYLGDLARRLLLIYCANKYPKVVASEYEDICDFNYGNGRDNPPTSMIMKKEFQREMLYHMSPEEDSILASMLLRPSPIKPFETTKFSGGDVDKVRRVYIKTMNDRITKPQEQEDMIRKWPPSEVMTIDTEHSPFFSAPEELCKLILKASRLQLTR